MDKLSKAIEVLKDAIRYSEKKMSEVCVKLDFEDADVILELLKEQPKWIQVGERLPEEDGFYLVCNRGFLPWIAELKTFMGIRGWCNGANMPVVKMWMPLPKTPEDGEQE